MFIVGFFVITAINLHSTLSDVAGNQYFCPDYYTQRNLDIKKVIGKWNVLKIITHERPDDVPPYFLKELEKCSVFTVEQENVDGNLTILNDSGNRTRTYYYGRSSKTDPGLWMISGPHTNEPVLNKSARVINGNVQVLKLVDEYAVLTFCTEEESGVEIFSYLLSREADFSPSADFMKYVNEMLRMKRLDTLDSVSYLCKKSDSSIQDEKKSEIHAEMVSSAVMIKAVLYLQFILMVMYKFLY